MQLGVLRTGVCLLVLMVTVGASAADRMAIVGDRSLFVDGTPVPASAVAQALAKTLGQGAQAQAFTYGFKEIRAFSPSAILLVQSSHELVSTSWPKDRDAFVPMVRGRLKELRLQFPKARIALGLPDDASMRATQELIPLLRQAARESGVETIDLALAPDRPDDDPAAVAASEIALSLADFRALKKGWKLVCATSEEKDEGPARFAIDGDPETYWHTRYSEPATKVPHELVVDLGKVQTIRGFRYVPRQDGGVNGRVKAFEIFVSLDGKDWGAPVAHGEFPSTAEPSRAMLEQGVRARFVRFVAISESNGGPWTSMAELDVVQG